MQKDELEKLLSKTHNDISIQDFDGKQIPCIEFTQERFDNIISCISGKPLSVDTNLNILQDGLGHVFVEIILTFSIGGLSEKVLVDASKNLDFFYVLSQNGILSIASKNTPEKVFMIQLPKPEKVQDALRIINDGLSKSTNN